MIEYRIDDWIFKGLVGSLNETEQFVNDTKDIDFSTIGDYSNYLRKKKKSKKTDSKVGV